MGYDINASTSDCLIDKDDLMIATIHSANGINDYLKEIFYNSIKKI